MVTDTIGEAATRSAPVQKRFHELVTDKLAGAVLLSLVLAGALWLSDKRGFAVVAAAFGLVFAVFDGLEVAHHLDESRTGLALLAAAVMGGHLAVAGLSGRAATEVRPRLQAKIPHLDEATVHVHDT